MASTSSFNYSFSLFLYYENAQNTVQGNPNFLIFFPGKHAPGPPYKFAPSLLTPTPPPPPPTKNPGYAPVWNKRRGANSFIYGTHKCVVGLWIYKINSLTHFYLLKLKYNRELRIEKSCPFNARKATKNVARNRYHNFCKCIYK